MSNDNKAMKVPQAGCDRLTDPSEIAALGKYLRKKRVDLEDSILLPTTKGAPTSDLKNNITSLSENVERLRTDKISLLEEDALHKIIGESKEINSLGNQKVGTEGVEEIIDKLSGNLEKLEGSKEVSLSDQLLGIKTKEENSLDGTLEKIEGEKEDSTLSDQLLTLKDERSVGELSKTASPVTGNPKDDNTLAGTVHRMVGNTDSPLKELEKTSKEVGGIHKDVESLESTTYTLNKKEVGLEEVLDSIPGERKDVELRTKKETISIDDIKELPIERVNLGLENNISSLDTNLIDIVGGEKKVSLEETLEKIGETTSLDNLPSNPAENVIGDSQKISQLIGENELIIGEKKNIENLGGGAITIDAKEVETLSMDEALDIIGSEKNPTLSAISEKPIGERHEPESLSGVSERIEGNEKEVSLKQRSAESIINAAPDDLSIENQQAEKVEGGVKSPDKLGESLEEVLGSTETIEQLKGEPEKVEGANPIVENLGENFTEKVKEDADHTIDNLSKTLNRVSDYEERNLGLEGTAEEVSGDKKEISSLGNASELLQGTHKTPELSKDISHIEGTKDSPELGKHIENVKGTSDTPELVQKVESLGETPETPELGDYREDITTKDVDSLSGSLEDVVGEVEDSELSSFLDSLREAPETPGLSDKVLKEVTPKEVSLEDEVLGITSEDVDSLSDFLDTLTSEDVDSLSGSLEDDGKVKYQPEWTGELEEGRVKAEKDDTDKINVGKNLIPGDKDDYQHTGWTGELDDRRIRTELANNKINVGKNLIPGDLDTYQHTGWTGKLDNEKRKVKTEDDDDKVNVSGDVHERFNPEEDSLYADNLSPEKKEKVNVGKNLIPDDPDDPDRDDYQHTGWTGKLDKRDPLEIKKGEDPTVDYVKADQDDLINQLVKIINSRKNIHLYYTNILKFAQNKNMRSGWSSKITALMSAYLSGESSEERLREFEQQLYKTIFFEYKEDFKETRTTDNKAEVESIRSSSQKLGENKGGQFDPEKDSLYTDNLSPGDDSRRKEIKLRNESTYVTKYKLNWSWQNVLNVSQYLRWVAEKATFGSHGSLRTLLLDTVLMTLVAARNVGERLTGANRDSVPGKNSILGKVVGMTQGNLVDNAKGAIKKIAKAGIGALTPDPNNLVDKTYPLNRPDDLWYQTTAWQKGNNRGSIVSGEGINKGLLKGIGKAMLGEMKGIVGIGGERDYEFKSNYISSNEALKTTLSELCDVDTSLISSVEDLKLAMESSKYMTTASKVTVDQFNNAKGRVTTLDDNSNWEIVFYPYLDDSTGFLTYLPPVAEINRLNRKLFNIETGYGSWIPFTSFELSKSKMVSRTIQLFDGEISYPVGMECTNDLRLTIADDQYKSWRRYFELCANCSVYYSTKHSMGKKESTTSTSSLGLRLKGISDPSEIDGESYNNKELVTKVDKSFICPAPYKNITFRCLIYCMTPQKETINKYDLLLVMKDFSEERSGDIDPGGSDLTISFSIVGEHPKDKDKAPSLLRNRDFIENKGYIETKNAYEKAKDKAALVMSIAQVAAETAVDGALNAAEGALDKI